ncbi:MAG: HAMP domain-containing protein, partial [Clostridia bacterium]|nr:HAMP domain-containing protein [Clostridia bacterium]
MKKQFKAISKDRPGTRIRRSSLFRRFFLISALMLLGTLLIAGLSLMIFVSSYWMNERTELLKKSVNSVANNAADVLRSEYMTENRKNSIMIICNNLNQISSAIDADIFVVDTEGGVIYCKDVLKSGFSLYTGSCMLHGTYEINENIMRTALDRPCSTTGDLDGMLDSLSFIVSSPVKVGEETVAVVFATQSLTRGLAPYILTIFRMFSYASMIGILFALIVAYISTARTTRPLRLMSEAASRYANGDFSYRIPYNGKKNRKPDEVSALIEAFNSMAQDLDALEMSRRSFIANVSHELKTPMTTIGGFIDGMLDGTISEDKQEQYLGIVSDEVKRLRRLVEQMLNLSRIESGEVKLNPSEFDISEMIVSTLLSFEQIIDSKSIDVRGLETFSQLKIIADRDMIYQVIYNLVDNAVKYTPQGGYIEVSAADGGVNRAVVRVTNSG